MEWRSRFFTGVICLHADDFEALDRSVPRPFNLPDVGLIDPGDPRIFKRRDGEPHPKLAGFGAFRPGPLGDDD